MAREPPRQHGSVRSGEGVYRGIGDVGAEMLAQHVQGRGIAIRRVDRPCGDAVESELRMLGQALDRKHPQAAALHLGQ